jgi:excisionase family DNA binding protein
LTLRATGWDNEFTKCTRQFCSVMRVLQKMIASSGVSSDGGVAFLVNESREVMNVRQASQYLGISPDTLYRYITEGEIPAFKLGNRWKLRKTILDRWMERKMSQAHARRR